MLRNKTLKSQHLYAIDFLSHELGEFHFLIFKIWQNADKEFVKVSKFHPWVGEKILFFNLLGRRARASAKSHPGRTIFSLDAFCDLAVVARLWFRPNEVGDSFRTPFCEFLPLLTYIASSLPVVTWHWPDRMAVYPNLSTLVFGGKIIQQECNGTKDEHATRAM